MAVTWLIRVQDRLQESLGTAGAGKKAFPKLLRKLGKILRATFPRAKRIVVLDRLAGYSQGPEKHILRVEVLEKGRSYARVVKIDTSEKLHRELDAWISCVRGANDRGRVFMNLAPGSSLRSRRGRYKSLVYEDALQTFRAADIVTLEQAVLRCCRWGTPSAWSLLVVLDQVFAEMVDRLYRQSWSQAPTEGLCDLWRERIQAGRRAWKETGTEQNQCQQAVLAEVMGQAPAFLDPCWCLERILDNHCYLPEMRQGCAHGDLHGRNILVGLVDGEARWPAIFDYEAMSRENFLAWDFAKLETELKVRALQVVFNGDERDFIDAAYKFENRLAEETESRNNLSFHHWQEDTPCSTPEERLFAMLLGLRRQAKKCLEVVHGLNRTWLHEYYFSLACYGVYAGRFATYERRDLVAAFVGAGLAAARYAWAHSDLTMPESAAQLQAQQAISRHDATAHLAGPAPLSHHPEFVFAREFVRSRQKTFVHTGAEILKDLRQRYPLALDVWQELALANAELYDLTNDEHFGLKAERVLIALDTQCPRPHFETLCRWGRLWKDRGDREFDRDPTGVAAGKRFATALTYYRRAYAQAENYYPGINAATLQLLLGQRADAEKLAGDILLKLETLPRDASEESLWVWASSAEAHLVLGDCQQAAQHYRRALLHPKCLPHHREAMKKQVQRILRIRGCDPAPFEQLFQGQARQDSVAGLSTSRFTTE